MTNPFAYLLRTGSPIGRLEVMSDGERVTGLTIERAGRLPLEGQPERSCPILRLAIEQLSDYFAGRRNEFELPVRFLGTSFQVLVWDRLAELGWGEWISYGELGAEIGRPGAARAIGGAVATNPVPIIVGCHRVLSADGKVTGYSGGEGIPTKLWLLEHEGITLAA